MKRRYSELNELRSFIERYRYLKLDGQVGSETFGFDRYLNQALYASPEWKKIRREVIIRDSACDLGVEGCYIGSKILIHHLNPITKEDILMRTPLLFDKENLICTSFDTHQAIHYGDENLLPLFELTERKHNDTIPWRMDLDQN